MTHRKLGVAGAVVALALGGGGAAMAATTAKAPAKTTIKESQKLVMKQNRYIQDGLRWNKDTYNVRSGGTLHLVDNVVSEGPHTFTVVKKKQLPKTAAQAFNCKICNKLFKAHGASPESNAPPKFFFLENGVGSQAPPNVNQPGDSALIGPGKKGESLNVKVTAKKGTTLHFMCIIHPWMQGKVVVG
jgi:uncharacterized cupredoxin-like copper-binding protein